MPDSAPPTAAFYFDLASPLCYLAAERVLGTLPGPAEWRPILARELAGPGAAEDFESWRCENEAEVFIGELARRAAELELAPLRMPEPFPFDSSLAMRVAIYAKSIGRAVPFAQAAFRQAYAGGRSLADPDNVVIAAAACEMHPRAVLAAAARESLDAELRDATAQAARAGVREVPALQVGEQILHGEREVERAAALMVLPAQVEER